MSFSILPYSEPFSSQMSTRDFTSPVASSTVFHRPAGEGPEDTCAAASVASPNVQSRSHETHKCQTGFRPISPLLLFLFYGAANYSRRIELHPLNSVGVAPAVRRKVLLKWLWLSNPVDRLISTRLAWPARSSALARSPRRSST